MVITVAMEDMVISPVENHTPRGPMMWSAMFVLPPMIIKTLIWMRVIEGFGYGGFGAG